MGQGVMTAAERTPQEAALAYAAIGWPVFPCRAGSKEPATRNGFHDATTDPAQIREWWRHDPDRNVAIATGAPGPDVVDVDVREGGSGFAALNQAKRAGLIDGYHAIVRTPSTGLHLYFGGTDQRSRSIRGRHLDFRSQGGYVVAPPSQAGGGRYVIVRHEPPTGATVSWDAVRGLLQPQPQLERTASGRAPGRDTGATSLDRLVEWTAARQVGDRNFPLFYAAKQAALAGQLDGTAVERFVDAALRSGLQGGEREARRTIASAQREAAALHPFAGSPQRELEAG
jgi:Bifunctional DNA primase/polymerase, N-terminal